jgi:hypothetical protein
MRKALMLIMVLGLTVTAKAGIQFSGNDSPVAENVLVTEASIIVIDIRTDDGLVYIVSGEPTEGGQQWVTRPAVMNTTSARGGFVESTRLFPDPMTIALLGLAGLLYRRQADTRPAAVVSIIKAR